jgi:Calcineurin-like phosphoesterase
MSRLTKYVFLAVVVLPFMRVAGSAQANATSPWTFAVSGDSRNCGDVIMPAIAAGAKEHDAAFYWHLGDLRATTFIDEDYLHEPEHNPAPDKSYYNKTEWDDFIQSQLNPFGSIPVFVGIGNHETYAPLNREEFITKFAPWLDAPPLRRQRLADNPNDHALRTYFHWIENGVDFVYLDNSTHDQFDGDQMAWFEGMLRRATADKNVKSVVVGMHAALPDSLASGHSMNDWEIGAKSGRRVYTDLQNFRRKTHKHVYILSSHSHFFMSGIFDSDYWRKHGGALPGWIVGTAGAMRYQLPATASRAKEARQKIYGYLLGSVRRDGSIDFAFEEIKREDIPAAVSQRYSTEFVDACFEKNMDLRAAPAAAAAH